MGKGMWDEEILKYLKDRDWTSPTDIAHGVCTPFGYPNRHSAWASPKCLRLVEEGLLERNDDGHYRIIRKKRKKNIDRTLDKHLKSRKARKSLTYVDGCHNCKEVDKKKFCGSWSCPYIGGVLPFQKCALWKKRKQ